MSLRRSARVQSQTSSTGDVAKDHVVEKVASTKRGRGVKPAEDVASSADTDMTADGSTSMPPPPTTPNKRRRMATAPAKPPPITTTPSAIGLMTSRNSAMKPIYSTGDIDDATPPPLDRPVEPHHTNATLITPRGTQVQADYSNFEESPSKPGYTSLTTTGCLLDHACDHLVKTSPKLKAVVDKHRCRVFSPEGLAEEIDPFRSLASGIMAQQVSGAAAKSIKNKFIALFPPDACPNGFPTPAIIAQTPLTRLREAGLSQRKAEYIQGLAERFNSGELTVSMLMNGSDEDVMEELVAVRGLGVWSVEMFMCFGLKRMDVFSTGDLGVQRGMAAFMGRDVGKLKNKVGKWKYMSEKEMLEISEPFRPYRSLFMWYMWRIEDVDVDAVQNA